MSLSNSLKKNTRSVAPNLNNIRIHRSQTQYEKQHKCAWPHHQFLVPGATIYFAQRDLQLTPDWDSYHVFSCLFGSIQLQK